MNTPYLSLIEELYVDLNEELMEESSDRASSGISLCMEPRIDVGREGFSPSIVEL
jgi:hypothetical protein